MTDAIPDDLREKAADIAATISPYTAEEPSPVILAIARALLAERTRTQKETAEKCAEVADKQAWAHGGVYFDAPELNSAAIAKAIRATFLEAKEG